MKIGTPTFHKFQNFRFSETNNNIFKDAPICLWSLQKSPKTIATDQESLISNLRIIYPPTKKNTNTLKNQEQQRINFSAVFWALLDPKIWSTSKYLKTVDKYQLCNAFAHNLLRERWFEPFRPLGSTTDVGLLRWSSMLLYFRLAENAESKNGQFLKELELKTASAVNNEQR